MKQALSTVKQFKSIYLIYFANFPVILFINDVQYLLYLFFELDMRAKHGRKESDVVKVETFNSMKNQLELQNAALMRERFNIQQQSRRSDGYSPQIPHADIQRNQNELSPINTQPPSQQHTPVQILKSKIFDIINFCHEQGDSSQFNEIVEAEKEVLIFLEASEPQQKRFSKEAETPIEKVSRKKKSKLNKTTAVENNKQSYLNISGDEAMEMIEEIQRKALVEIQSLRADKISLLKKLNEEIKAHNKENKIRISLQNKLKRFEIGGQMEIVAEQSQESVEQDSPQVGYQQPPRQPRTQPKSTVNSQQLPNPTRNTGPSPHPHPLTPNPTHNQLHQNTNAVNSPKNNQGGFNQQGEDIARQVERLNNENKRIKLALSNSHPSLKNKLRSELNELEGKIRFYQQLLTKNHKPENVDMRELELLINQANSINEEGSKLLKTKRIPEYRTTLGSEEDQARFRPGMNEQNTKKPDERATFDYSRPPLQTFSPLDKSYHSQTYKSGFSPTKYENLIQQMNKATKV